jgi:hypothetical protein
MKAGLGNFGFGFMATSSNGQSVASAESSGAGGHQRAARGTKRVHVGFVAHHESAVYAGLNRENCSTQCFLKKKKLARLVLKRECDFARLLKFGEIHEKTRTRFGSDRTGGGAHSCDGG